MIIDGVVAIRDCVPQLPSIDTLILTLQTCREKRNLDTVNRAHVQLSIHGLASSNALGNCLLSMYAECRDLYRVEQVFRCLCARNEYAWTTLIQGYVECGEAELAFEAYNLMQEEGMDPSTYTYVALLKACTKMKWVERGYVLHAEMAKEGLDFDPFVSSTLVHMYFKLCMLAEAHNVLDSLPARDLVLWTALISGYAEQGKCQEALFCFNQMQLEGMVPDPVTYICSLKACGLLGDVEKGLKMHGDLVRKGFDGNLIVGNTLIDMYARFGLLADAKEVFEKLVDKDIVSWNALASGYAEHGLGVEVLNLLDRMILERVQPDKITYVCCLRGCSCTGAFKKGQHLHAEIVEESIESDPYVGTTLVDFYVKCGKLVEARETLDEMQVRDLVPWTAMVAGYAEHGYEDEVLDCYCQMLMEGVPLTKATFSSVIFAYAGQGEAEKTYQHFIRMQEQGLLPDSSIFVGVLVACGNSHALELGMRIHAQSYKISLGDVILATAAIDMYGSCGSMDNAHQLLDTLPTKAVITWNSLLTGYAHHGNSDLVFNLFEKMKKESVQPDKVTFLNLVSVCSHLGLYKEVFDCFEDMKKKGISPNLKHYTCLVDLLCRTGQLDEAVAMLKKLPIQPSLSSWHTVMSACHKWGSVKLGRHAFDHAVDLDEDHGAAYILMSNMYSDAELWEEMNQIEVISHSQFSFQQFT
ncbi:hypothetical protein GOP47_0001188 [Adiantum capillus-veneris]|uniref:Pentatricopeptide repeat-containing protein n=1 Tax=Adiantum capillus-veneris TaxID=13818 RepID=A0A9D4VEP2_ADICA|nr:hypothetical protein GOP47_0001188 [Adiantum capillus-veneris]